MPRRKQERPKYVGSPQELAISLQNGIGSGSSSETEESDEHVCGKCRAEFPSLADFLLHKKRCSAKTPVLLDASEEDDDEDEEGDESPRPLPPQLSQWLAANLGSNVTLAELENTCVAVSQQAQLGDILYTFHRNQAQSYELLQAITKMLREAGGLAGPQVPYLHQEAPPAETNTLALLEKQAEKCIQDSMARKSFLNGMEDERSKKKGESDPACRHKCHYCGKLLGSDSALQIHLRSHTGEKPFQCSVCGSSFSTRGNLKVHCQRHREQQNLHPLPFALDNPPPLLGPDGEVKADVTKPEQALDFSKTLNGGRKSPHCESQSRSVSPNGTFSDNSNDGSSDENLNEDYSHLKIDVEQFDDEDDEEERDSNHPMDEDESPVRQSFSTSPNFAPYFFPPPYDNLGSTNGNNNNNNTGPCNNNNENGGPEGSDSILQDPSYYQDLLPKIGSNDNSWESLIEVTKTSETSKLQQLVDNIENKLTDPNQCIICHRVLSCKSALQMHYRTHTGERPYKCKLCNRAFTTKGNLKTHMGVHRTKPPSRLMHQCPVCHRQFPNSVILQQHVQTHTAEQGLPLFADDRPLLPPSYPRQFQPLALTKGDSPRPSESVIRPTGVMEGGRNESSPPPLSRSCSPASEKSPNFESPPKEPVNGSSEKDEPMEEAKAEPSPKPVEASPMEVVVPPEPKYSSHSIIVPTSGDCPLPFGMPPYPPLSCSAPYTASLTALENHVKSITSNVTHPLPFPPHYGLSGFFPPRDGYGFSSSNGPKSSPKSSSDAEEQCTPKGDSQKESAGAPLDLTPRGSPAHFQRPTADLKMFQPLVGLPFGPPTTHRISTTCRVCYKTFACNSALEIHYRSHTKERPFRCEVCDRGFSTKGNMRQHMLTHKIRDFPSPAAFSEPEAKITPPPPAPPKKEEKRPEPPKRAPGQPKHMCQVCHKPFSSGSALQIHMRTHTGDKPFQCNICHRAFTTKGNLKVHMGTHMWNNSTSRRGRRMSLDITPLQLAPGGKPGEFVQAAPFFPYLAPFMNGLPPPPPKMNEISVIQTAGQQPLALLAKEDAKAKEETQPQPPQVGAWPWKISCNACNKICGSSTELELHVRNNHCNNSNGSSNKEPSTAETERTD